VPHRCHTEAAGWSTTAPLPGQLHGQRGHVHKRGGCTASKLLAHKRVTAAGHVRGGSWCTSVHDGTPAIAFLQVRVRECKQTSMNACTSVMSHQGHAGRGGDHAQCRQLCLLWVCTVQRPCRVKIVLGVMPRRGLVGQKYMVTCANPPARELKWGQQLNEAPCHHAHSPSL